MDSHKNVARTICSVLFVFAAMVAYGDASASVDPQEWLGEAEAAYDKVRSYTAVSANSSASPESWNPKKPYSSNAEKRLSVCTNEMDKKALRGERIALCERLE